MTAVGLGTYKNTKNYNVISDTGTSFIGGPKTVTDQLATAAGAKVCQEAKKLVPWRLAVINFLPFQYSAVEESYTIACNAKPPTLDVTIGSHVYSIDPVNYIVSVSLADLYE